MQSNHRSRIHFALTLLAALVLSTAPLLAKGLPPIRIAVDLREAPRRILHARLVIPAAPGPLTLLYPKWIPGHHRAAGPIADVAGVKFTAGGKPLAWRRDDVDMYAFHCDVPVGADSIEVTLDYLSPSKAEGSNADPAATAQLAVLTWDTVLLYPKGQKSDDLTYAATLQLPAGWKFATALEVASESTSEIVFHPVSLATLVDAPVIAGANLRAVPLGGEVPHRLNLAGDTATAVAIGPELVERYKRLVAEAAALFGARHYRHYDFLLALSDHIRSSGLEHHESSDNRVPERTLLDPDQHNVHASLLPHEFVHSWNGKYRRPADLATPDYHEPMRGSLLWVYEGLTTYLGNVLAARTGLWTPEQYREQLAWVAAYLDQRPGRTWRPLADTAIAAQLLYGGRKEWASWRRSVDFYDESDLIWLEADTIIRRESQGRRSMDDFCRLFHGGTSGGAALVPYTFEDVVATMTQVVAYDWRGFFTTRLNSTAPRAPLGGLEGSGWRLVFNDIPNAYLQSAEETERVADLRFSLGLTVKSEENENNGVIVDVVPGTPAAQAGIAPGMKLVAVNGREWSPMVLREVVRAAKGSSTPIELLVENTGYYRTYQLDHHDGERYPHLARDAARPDLLEQIIRPRASAGGAR